MTKTITEQKRDQLQKMLDKFSTFTWDGKSSWDFGAFIINDNREGLKFYNGPSFSNEYTSPQFAKNKELIGVNFEQQKISFKIGVYWVSIDEYRQFLNWLNPYVISNLTFSFADKWYYLVKLTGREESTRYIIGYDGAEPRYYSEMTLNFEVQGEPCLYSMHEFKWYKDETTYKIWTADGYDWPVSSDLPVDLQINLTFTTASMTSFIKATIYYVSDNTDEDLSKELFSVSLQNLTYESESGNTYDWNLTYSSKDGLLYLSFGGEKYKLLNLLTTTTSGKEIVQSMSVNKLQLPGRFSNNKIDYSKIYIKFDLDENTTITDNYQHEFSDDDCDGKDKETEDSDQNDSAPDRDMDIQIHARARVNIV